MSILIIVEIFSVLTVLGLFAWVFKKQKNADEDVFIYARYMIYLLVAEVVGYVIFHINEI
ncbi:MULTISPECIES: hypothetical protein [Bacillus]|uniref:hypothetical protein n=1 Tax=Bacillus TaxID=1386 RepID=UPI00057C130B|nr:MULTISPECIES: hypothetical protein [Bacillus]PJZ01179.1 hypothetical protein CPT06_06160 [Bacillus vallismortis]